MQDPGDTDRRDRNGEGGGRRLSPHEPPSIGETFLAAAAARDPNETWLTLVAGDGQDRDVSTTELLGEVQAWQAWVQAQISAPGERVIICLEPSLALYASFLGAILAGAVPSIFAPPSAKQKKEDACRVFQVLLQSSKSRVLVTTVAEFAGLAGDRVVASPQDIDRDVQPRPLASARPGDVAFVQYSSGTTGLKKGVAVTHSALVRHIADYTQSIALSPRDRIVSWLPLYHDMGLITALFMPLLTGVPLVAMSPLDWASRPTMLFAAIERHRPTLCWQPNFAYNFLSRFKGGTAYDLSSIRLWVNCSERIMDESHQMFADAFGGAGVRRETLGACYAMAENVFAVTSSYPGAAARVTASADALAQGRFAAPAPGAAGTVLVSSGRPLDAVSVRILDPAGHLVADGQMGEIAIRTPWLFDGYAAEDSAQFLDGHFLTGDTGFLHGGELFVLGRKKDVLIIAGRNLFPQDVEAIVDETPGVVPGRCAAFTIPNPKLGTEALVVLAETRETDSTQHSRIVQEITARVGNAIGIAPERVHLTPHMGLIKATSGKISRALNRDAYLAQIRKAQGPIATAPTTAGPPASDVRGNVRQAIITVLRRKPLGNVALSDDASMFEIGVIDSLSYIELILELERVFGAPAPAEMSQDARSFDSVDSIVRAIEKQPKAQAAGGAPHPSAESQLLQMRERRTALAPQFADTDGVLLQPLPYVMLAPTPNYRSATANTDIHGFRVAIKDGATLSSEAFAKRPGDKGIILGNSMSWGTGASTDANVIHNVLNREMADTAWYSYALRQSVLTQERIAANLFAPLDVTHVVWITGSVLVMNGLTRMDHKAYLPFPEQLRFQAALGLRPDLKDMPSTLARAEEIGVHMEREMAMLSRIYRGARNLLFVWQPTLMHYDKPMGPEERDLEEIARRLPGKPIDPNRIRAQRVLSNRLAEIAEAIAPRYGIQFVNPMDAPIFRSDAWLFVDLEHLNDRGNAALAGLVRAALV